MIVSLVQLVAGVTVMFGPCPEYMPAQHFSCYYPTENTIYLLPEDQRDPEHWTLLHEYGHAYDFQVLKRADRLRFRRVMGYTPTRRWWDSKVRFSDRGDSLSPGEAFAENYAACAGGFWWPNARRFCRLLPPSSFALWLRAAL